MNFLDDSHWVSLATARGIRLPYQNTACTTGGMVRWLRKLGWDMAMFRAWCGYSKRADWLAANPDWPLRAFVGLLLEEDA